MDSFKQESSAPAAPSQTDPGDEPAAAEASGKGKGLDFWLSFIAIIASVFLSALDLTAVSTALPTITRALNGEDNFTWIGSAYALSSTAILPLSGALADIFGRKPAMLGFIAIFAIGSAFAGSAQSMSWLIAARTVQGIGGGGILNLTETLVSDLVPLAERGLYQGILGLIWSFACGIGPPIGGAFADSSWRWLFYLNLPMTGIAFGLVWFFLRVRTPEGSIVAKLARVDWLGNFIIVAGTTLAVVGLTFGGIRFPWDSAQVLAPLIIGFALIVAFMWYEVKVPREPTIPWVVLGNRTTIGGYLGTLVHGITSIALIYYLPVYFQAVLGSSPIRSGVQTLATTLVVAPFALIAGLVVQIARNYRWMNVIGWIISIVGFGITSLLRANAPPSKYIGYQLLVSMGLGIIWSATIFPVLAPLPVSRTASALAVYAFVRSFAQTWGITIASTVLQNQLKDKLPAAFTAQFPDGLEIAFAAIPIIKGLDEPLRSEVRAAFADSMRTIWLVMVGISGLGLFTVAMLREVPMQMTSDERYALEGRERTGDAENLDGKVDISHGRTQLEPQSSRASHITAVDNNLQANIATGVES